MYAVGNIKRNNYEAACRYAQRYARRNGKAVVITTIGARVMVSYEMVSGQLIQTTQFGRRVIA